jgi:hypothetical protein
MEMFDRVYLNRLRAKVLFEIWLKEVSRLDLVAHTRIK